VSGRPLCFALQRRTALVVRRKHSSPGLSLEETVTKNWFDAETVTRTALSGGADAWFDAYWYRDPSSTGRRRVSQATQWLRDRIDDARRLVRRVRAREIVAAFAPFGLVNQRTIITSTD
jgi:hypothetical protein